MPACRRKALCPPAGGDPKGAALARGKRLPPEKTDEIAPRKGVNFVAFPVPEKPLAACYPDLGDGQRCSAALRAPQAQQRGKQMSEGKLSEADLAHFTGSENCT